MNGVKRLTPPQSRKVNALVRRTCCNYDNGNCILQYRRTSSFELLKKYLEENADEWDEW